MSVKVKKLRKAIRRQLALVAPRLNRFEEEAPRFLVRHRLILGSTGLLLCALFLWRIPKRQVAPLGPSASEAEIIAAEDRARSTLAQIFGGVFLLVGLGFTWWRIEVSRQGQITERFTRAVEQLGSSEFSVRAGAVYALERIAGESEKDRWSIISLIAAFIRNRCPLEGSPLSKSVGAPQIPSDAQTALSVLGRLLTDEDFHEKGWTIDLRNTDLRGAVLDRASLPGALFTGARLDGASLVDANLQRATFLGASLEMANLTGANLELADFEQARAPHADLSTAFLSGATLKEANFEGADLSGADLDGVVLIAAHFEGADLRDTIGVPFMFPLPFARVYVDGRTRVSNDMAQWFIRNAPASWSPRRPKGS